MSEQENADLDKPNDSLPAETPLQKSPVSERLKEIAELLRSEQKPTPVTVREFLGWFDAYRRGYKVVRSIRFALQLHGITTVPDFESAYIDSLVQFRKAEPKKIEVTTEDRITIQTDPIPAAEDPQTVSIGISDPVYRIGRLPAANASLVTVKPDSAVSEVVTLMLANDFSQIPVMTSPHSLKGVITWKTLASRWALKIDGAFVRDFMETAPEVSGDVLLFSAIPTIAKYGFVLVKDGSNKYSGIVTASDLSIQFQQLSEPFLLLGEIENHIRWLIDGKFTKDELQQAKDPSDTARVVESVADLTFGEYIRILEKPTMWAKLSLGIERQIFVRELDRVRDIRNDVMHFEPDPLGPSELETLRRFSSFLQGLQAIIS